MVNHLSTNPIFIDYPKRLGVNMYFVLSPAKSLNSECRELDTNYRPLLLEETAQLVKIMKQKGAIEIKSLMGVSDAIAELNYQRYQSFEIPYANEVSHPAITLFDGDVYKNIKTDIWSDEDFKYAQEHGFILSGLYGLIRPLDRILPYRLEMGTSLENNRGKNLYAFWGNQITNQINNQLNGKPLVNLASKEYFKSIKLKDLDSKVIQVDFKEWRDGKLKMIGFNAKRARGMMADYIVRERLNNPDDLKNFKLEGYEFSASDSSENHYLYTFVIH